MHQGNQQNEGQKGKCKGKYLVFEEGLFMVGIWTGQGRGQEEIQLIDRGPLPFREKCKKIVVAIQNYALMSLLCNVGK